MPDGALSFSTFCHPGPWLEPVPGSGLCRQPVLPFGGGSLPGPPDKEGTPLSPSSYTGSRLPLRELNERLLLFLKVKSLVSGPLGLLADWQDGIGVTTPEAFLL